MAKSKLTVSEYLGKQAKKLEEIENAIQELQELPAFNSNLCEESKVSFTLSSKTELVHMDVYLNSNGHDYDLLDKPLFEVFDSLVLSCLYSEDDLRTPVLRLLESALARVKNIKKR